jgi:hypothetical protein
MLEKNNYEQCIINTTLWFMLIQRKAKPQHKVGKGPKWNNT